MSLLCGIDGTALYNIFHGDNPQYLNQMVGIELQGVLVSSVPSFFPSESPISISPTGLPTASPTTAPRSNMPTSIPSEYPSASASSNPTQTLIDAPTPNYSTTSQPTIDTSIASEYPTNPVSSVSSDPNAIGPSLSVSNDPLQTGTSSNHLVITSEEMAKHNSADDCWVSYFGECYDVTQYAPTHPGGASLVTSNCGEDNTEAYTMFHDYTQLRDIKQNFYMGVLYDISSGQGQSQPNPLEQLPPPEIEPYSESADNDQWIRPTTPLGFVETPQPGGDTISLSELRRHNSVNDCWVCYFGECFDVTDYAPTHPGGSSLVTGNCGHDDTESFSLFHNYDKLVGEIRLYLKGILQTETVGQSTTDQQTSSSSQTGSVPIADTDINNGKVTLAGLQQHSTSDNNCWVSYYGEVYNMKVRLGCSRQIPNKVGSQIFSPIDSPMQCPQ